MNLYGDPIYQFSTGPAIDLSRLVAVSLLSYRDGPPAVNLTMAGFDDHLRVSLLSDKPLEERRALLDAWEGYRKSEAYLGRPQVLACDPRGRGSLDP